MRLVRQPLRSAPVTGTAYPSHGISQLTAPSGVTRQPADRDVIWCRHVMASQPGAGVGAGAAAEPPEIAAQSGGGDGGGSRSGRSGPSARDAVPSSLQARGSATPMKMGGTGTRRQRIRDFRQRKPIPKTENSADLAHYFPENGGDYPPLSQKWGGRVPPVPPPVAEPLLQAAVAAGPAPCGHSLCAAYLLFEKERMLSLRKMESSANSRGRGNTNVT